jgi:dihydroxy-acid dehydratase|tara:strand:- start:415 stop:519 length:105 start_codon:yes stop_codon:yes gene_type:complete
MCFDAEEDLMAQVVRDHESLRGKVIVIRYKGPRV